MDNNVLRNEIDRLISAHDVTSAVAQLSRLWRQNPGLSTACYLVSCYEKLRPHISLVPCRVALLRSFTVEPLVPFVRAAGFVHGIDLEIYVSDFNTYAQEILNPASQLYRFDPQIAILAVQTRDIAPDLWAEYASLTAEEIEVAIARVVAGYKSWIKAFRTYSNAQLIVHSLEAPYFPSQGLLDYQSDAGQLAALRRINEALRCTAASQKGVYLLDYDALIARHGRIRWHDEQKWLTSRMPISAEHLPHLANEWLRYIHPMTGKTCKVLVTDLDNTLWGGVIGEDGMDGIQLGPEYPGGVFQALQRTMMDLYKRGILLAVCSKNNFSDAMEVFERHPGMLLKTEHFASLRINWNDKARNLREIAAELNVGIDSLAFLDDNPVERERIRRELPEVNVIELPEEPMEFSRVLRETPVFERLTLSDEDRERGRFYGEQRQRVDLERSTSSLEDFYRSLRQEVEIARMNSGTLTRVAQLTQKTNQFNLTTRRYSEPQIADLGNDPNWAVYTVRVKDRFGDNGLVGVAITHDSEELTELDTFLLSCRVVGRTVETAILSFLTDQSWTRGAMRLQGWFLPTKKNDLAREFYAQHKFQRIGQTASGTLWSLELTRNTVACPEWIELKLDTPPRESLNH
jgi:FkbH-like protein